MQDYVVRSTVTHAESAARRAADVILVLLICAAAVFLIFKFIWVPVGAVSPQVNDLQEGDIVIIDRISKWFAQYRPGDIVRAEAGEGLNAYRVAVNAVEGDKQVTVRGGRLYVDGGLLDESEYASGLDPELDMECTVPQGSVLVLPDERGGVASLEDYVLPAGEVYGKLRFRIYPLNRLSIFG